MFKFALSLFLVCMTSLSSVSVDFGPFSVRLPVEVEVDSPSYGFFVDPVCAAIRDRNLLLMFIETEDDQTERILFEPYSFGYNEDRNLVLQGIRISEISPEISEDSSDGKGYFGGVYSTFKAEEGWTDFNIKKIIEIRVLKDSVFEIREDQIKEMNEANTIVEPVCQIIP